MPRKQPGAVKKFYGRTEPARSEIRNAADRGLKLRFWLHHKRITVEDFSAATGLGTSTLNRYFKGEYDLAEIGYEEAYRLIRGIGMSDEDVWELLAIPEGNRHQFHSKRKVGGTAPGSKRIKLHAPMYGRRNEEQGAWIRLDPDDLTTGVQVVELTDGQFMSVPVDNVETVSGKRLGRLVGVDF